MIMTAHSTIVLHNLSTIKLKDNDNLDGLQQLSTTAHYTKQEHFSVTRCLKGDIGLSPA